MLDDDSNTNYEGEAAMSNEHDICIACSKPCESGQNECQECRAELGRQYRAWLRGDTDNAWAAMVSDVRNTGAGNDD